MIIPVVVAVVVLAVIAVIGFIIYKKKTGERPIWHLKTFAESKLTMVK